MCGIAGSFTPRGRVDVARLERMSRLLRHRGPDDEGLVLIDPAGRRALTLSGPDTPEAVMASTLPYAPGRWQTPAGDSATGSPVDAGFQVGLVNRRLAIVDLSPAGHTPMCDSTGELWITYNGEIYNWVELRAELEREGAKFRSHTDTEVALEAYRLWGPESLERMNGMFAFAIWDGRRRELFCARDRLGVKPFYYAWQDGAFMFASEPGALVLSRGVRPAVRQEAVLDFIAYDWVDHEASTFFDGVMALPAGHTLRVSADTQALRAWWRLDPDRRARGGPQDWEAELRDVFTDAVRIRLRADVEVGACLSGGIDSTAVVTTAARQLDHPLHAFTCAYDEGPAYDERPFVCAAVEASGAASHIVVPDGGDFWSSFDRLTLVQNEPTAGAGLYSQWKVMELANRAGLKVLLDGQGGDETLAGYGRYLPTRLRDLLGDGRFGAFASGFSTLIQRQGMGAALALTFEPWMPRAVVAPLRQRFGQGKDRALSRMVAGAAHERAAAIPRPPHTFPTGLGNHLAFDTLTRMLPSLLRYEDRNSMAFSIETRLPFLDYRFVELAFSLPDDQKLDGTLTKAILRRSLGDRVPRKILDRRDKMGFETPADVWLRGRYAQETRRRLLAAGPLHDWLDRSKLEVELDDYLSGQRAIGPQVWRWLSLESWLRQYVANPSLTTRPAPVTFRERHRRSTLDEPTVNDWAAAPGAASR